MNKKKKKRWNLETNFFFKLWLYLGSRKFWPRKKTTWSSFYIDPKKTIIISNYAVTKKSFFFIYQTKSKAKQAFISTIHPFINPFCVHFLLSANVWMAITNGVFVVYMLLVLWIVSKQHTHTHTHIQAKEMNDGHE